MTNGRLLHVNVSAGGVPKRPGRGARVTRLGLEATGSAPSRCMAVRIVPSRSSASRRSGASRPRDHPIAPGTTGENLTTEGFDVSLLPVGTRLAIGDEVVLELASAADPCRTIRHSFRDHRFGRLGRVTHPADSRMYARVVRGNRPAGDPIVVVAPETTKPSGWWSRRASIAVRSACLSLWRAAADGGAPIAILDDGDLAAAASAALPSRAFNQAVGFAHLPNLSGLAVRHFRDHGAIGWVWADDEPWAGAHADGDAVHAAARPSDLVTAAAPQGLVIRELSRTEVGPWAEIMIEANGMPGSFADAWRAMEGGLADAPHDHRFLAEIDGMPVAAAAIHTHHGVGYLRAGSVLPTFRGRGIQRALIAARVAHAARLGCDLVGLDRRSRERSPPAASSAAACASSPSDTPTASTPRTDAARRAARRASGAKRATSGMSGTSRRVAAARRRTPRSRASVHPIPYWRRMSGRRSPARRGGRRPRRRAAPTAADRGSSARSSGPAASRAQSPTSPSRPSTRGAR